MTRKFNTHAEIKTLVRSFEDATISREAWKHAEHLVVALYYLEGHDLNAATDKMRAGIFNLLKAGFGVDLEREMPYHETLTVFWMRTVFAFKLMHEGLTMVERANLLIETFDKDHPLEFYSREVLFSDDARTRYVASDLKEH